MTRQRRQADPEAVLLVLRAMGAGVNEMRDVPDALARRKQENKERGIEPVLVAWDGKLGNRRLEFGYHEIELRGHPVFVISAPTKAYFPAGDEARLWGTFAPVYALHSKRNPSGGDLSDFENLIEWMNRLGGSVAA